MTPVIVRLRELRIEKGLSQMELAAAAGTRQATISQLEAGRTRRIDLDVLERIGAALGVRPTDLLADAPPRRRRMP